MSRKSGVLLHISSLWGNFSCGSFGRSCYEFIDFLSKSGFSIWQVLPFCLPDSFNSPYCSYSAFSLNPDFIDLTLLKDEGLLTEDELSSAEQSSPYCCEFERLGTKRLSLLKKASDRFCDYKALENFYKAHQQTDDFCRFMALKASNNNLVWRKWRSDMPDESALKLWRFTQYIAFKQWLEIKSAANANGISIIGDIPIYVSHDSADVWANPDIFRLDEKNCPLCVAGVPPDYFCSEGQLWGNPLYNWEKMKADDYSWWKNRILFMCELFDGIRLDHFRALESYYSIPAGSQNAKNGSWIKGPGLDFINTIKKLCPDKLIIAEDLGEITEDVEKLVSASGFPGMRVMQFGFLNDEDSVHLPHNYPKDCVAYTGTHDNNTLLGFVWELDEKKRQRLLDYVGFKGDDWGSCYDDILRTMLASHADTVIFPIQDLLLYGSDTRFNTPGKTFGNWGFRLTKDQLSGLNTDKFLKWNTLFSRL